MGRIQLRGNPLVIFLLILICYGSVMTKISIQRMYEEAELEAERRSYQGNEEEEQLSEWKHNTPEDRPWQSWLHTAEDFYKRLSQPQMECRKLKQLGGRSCKRYIDNDKFVCLDSGLQLRPKHCNVYSFGIGDDSTFDDMMQYYGCDVYMFDPTVNPINMKNVKKRQKFYNWGLDNHTYTTSFSLSYQDDSTKENLVGEFTTYDNIKQRLGHQNLVVHYLKLDIEGSEWGVLQYMMKNNLFTGIQQLAIEIHTTAIIKLPQEKVLEQLSVYWEILSGLETLGFQRVFYRNNPVLDSLYHVPGQPNKTIPTCAEILYIRKHSFLISKLKGQENL